MHKEHMKVKIKLNGSRGNRVLMPLKAAHPSVNIPLAALLLSGCAGSIGSNGYELDVAGCHASGGEVLINHNSETSRCIY